MNRAVVRIVAVLTIALLAACQPASGSVDGWDYGVITNDGADDYSTSGSSSTIAFTAPKRNDGGNLRTIGARAGAPESTNQTACATWDGDDTTNIQPGVAVRARISKDRRRAITLTSNVFFGARGLWNIHYADSAASTQMKSLGSFDFSAVLGGLTASKTNPPWRFCLRVEGPTVTAKVWPAGQSEPSWTDPAYAKTITIPSKYTFPGRPGWYMGHLAPGQYATLSGM